MAAEIKDWNDFVNAGGDPRKAADAAWTTTPHTIASWLTRDIPPPDFLLGLWLSTSTRALLVGATGLGKTMLGLEIAFAVAARVPFLHWTAKRPGKVLYVDGEMPRRQMKKRIADLIQRHGGDIPDNLTIISKEDYEDMPPLNTEPGQKWMDRFLMAHGHFDLVIFDNIQALLVGDMRDEEQWAKALPWVRSLTRRSIGQIWFHHTGHDESRSYGSKAREWQMDCVAIMEKVHDPESDLSFSLKFTKARERTPESRDDFEPIIMRLKGDQWTYELADAQAKPSGQAIVALNMLTKAITEAGERPPSSNHIPPNVRAVRLSLWRKYCDDGMISETNKSDSKRIAFDRSAKKLQAIGKIAAWGEWVWPL
jgi:AAA domain